MPQWWVSLQSPVTTEVRDALTGAGIGLTGLAHGLNETSMHASVQVEAESANDAVAMTRRALAGLQVIVDPDAHLLSD